MTNKATYKIYYSLLAAATLCVLLWTLFIGGRQVTFGRKVAKLQVQQHNLVQHQTQLQLELSQQLSLTSAENYAQENGFINITQPVAVTVTAPSTVASR
jgi:hypothetical protein